MVTLFFDAYLARYVYNKFFFKDPGIFQTVSSGYLNSVFSLSPVEKILPTSTNIEWNKWQIISLPLGIPLSIIHTPFTLIGFGVSLTYSVVNFILSNTLAQPQIEKRIEQATTNAQKQYEELTATLDMLSSTIMEDRGVLSQYPNILPNIPPNEDIPTYLINNKENFLNTLRDEVKNFDDAQTKLSDIKKLINEHNNLIDNAVPINFNNPLKKLETFYLNQGIIAMKELYAYKSFQKLEANLQSFKGIYARRNSITQQYSDEIKNYRHQYIKDEMTERIIGLIVCSAIPLLGQIIVIQSLWDITARLIQEPYLILELFIDTRNMAKGYIDSHNKALEKCLEESIKNMEKAETSLVSSMVIKQ